LYFGSFDGLWHVVSRSPRPSFDQVFKKAGLQVAKQSKWNKSKANASLTIFDSGDDYPAYDWQFTFDKTRVKLNRHYPKI
jgi:hypothetical protein